MLRALWWLNLLAALVCIGHAGSAVHTDDAALLIPAAVAGVIWVVSGRLLDLLENGG
jgi:hypothetical protein